MILGVVTLDDTPLVVLRIAGQSWTAIIDTGFNGDFELPDSLMAVLDLRPQGAMLSSLAAGQIVAEEVFLTDLPFDGQSVEAAVTFVPGPEILIGTHLLREYRLEIHFVNRTVHLERVA